MVTPILNSKLSFSSSGGLKVNLCKREVKKINSSALANCSPRHTRFPERQEHKTSYLSSWCRCPEGLKSSLESFKSWTEGGPARPRGFLYRDSFNLTTPGLSKAQTTYVRTRSSAFRGQADGGAGCRQWLKWEALVDLESGCLAYRL